MPATYLLRYQLPKGSAVLTLGADINLPGPTVHKYDAAPQELVEAMGKSSTNPNGADYLLDFEALPGALSQLASFLVPRVAQPIKLLKKLSIMQKECPVKAGDVYADAGWFVGAGDRMLRWLLAKENGGLLGSTCPVAAHIAELTDDFLSSPARLRLADRAAFMGHIAEIGSQPGLGSSARNAVRAVMTLASEYQPWEAVNPKQPDAAGVFKGLGCGMLRRLAEAAAKKLPTAKRAAYYEALTNELLTAVDNLEPLPQEYPANRHRAPLTDKQVLLALAA